MTTKEKERNEVVLIMTKNKCLKNVETKEKKEKRGHFDDD